MIIEASLQARKVFRVVFFFLNPHVSLTFTGEESFCQDQRLTLLSSQEGRKEGWKEGWQVECCHLKPGVSLWIKKEKKHAIL